MKQSKKSAKPDEGPRRKPTGCDYAERVLTGKLMLDEVPEAWRDMVASMLIHPVWLKAAEVIRHADKDRRRKALDRVPASVRGMVEAEARKIFARRLQHNHK